MAPGSQEATFLSEDEHEEGESSMARVSDKVPLAHRVIHQLKCRRSMIRFRKRTKSIRFFLNQTTRSLKERIRLQDFEIHDSSIGKTAPVCDKSFSQLLGAKPVDGLRLSQSLWAKSENLLRSASHVLGTAEFFLLAVGALLQGKEGDDLARTLRRLH
jgi:hypothetical protein